MNNYIHIMIAVLEKAGIFTEKEAEKLSKELIDSTLPDTYLAAKLKVEELFKKLEITTTVQKSNKVDTSK